MSDQNRKTLRSFYCRDYLWETFEQMTSDLGCSMDYLINESMRAYARSREYAAEEPTGRIGTGPGQPSPYGNPPARPRSGTPQAPAPMGNQYPSSPPPAPGAFGAQAEQRTFNQIPSIPSQGPPQPPQPPGFGAAAPPPPPRQQPGWGHPAPAPPQVPSGFSSQVPSGFGAPVAPGAQQPVFLVFNNNRYVVDKDKFVIGRGSQQTDLTIRDGNISRKHCAVIFRNGAYYIKDLESTNGIEYRGSRIESKKIEEGDTFFLCDYELRFTYRP